MFYGPIVGGLITQHLNFEWAAAVQGGLAFLAVSIGLCRFFFPPHQHYSLTALCAGLSNVLKAAV